MPCLWHGGNPFSAVVTSTRRTHSERTLDALNHVVEAVLHTGRPVWQVAAEWGMEPLAIRRRIRRWLPQAADLRQRVVQQADTWGIPLA